MSNSNDPIIYDGVNIDSNTLNRMVVKNSGYDQNGNSNITPNIVVESPTKRKILNVFISSIALLVGTAIVVDGVTPEFDISQFTVPVSAGLMYVAAFFNIAVTLPNTPKN